MNLQKEISTTLQNNPGTLPSEIAHQLNESELTIIRNLPVGMATELSNEHFETILKEIKDWGPVTTIIEVAGCIFEIKSPFPDGSNKYGYYNFITRDNPFQGHLKVENISAIVLVSKLFHGVITHSISFFDEAEKSIFKVYLGRNTDRSFIKGQELRFELLKKLALNNNKEQ